MTAKKMINEINDICAQLDELTVDMRRHYPSSDDVKYKILYWEALEMLQASVEEFSNALTELDEKIELLEEEE